MTKNEFKDFIHSKGNPLGTVSAPPGLGLDCAFRVNNSDMTECGIKHGDTVYVRYSDGIDPGRIGLIFHNGKMRICRVSVADNGVGLSTDTERIRLTVENTGDFRILGEVMALARGIDLIGIAEKENLQ